MEAGLDEGIPRLHPFRERVDDFLFGLGELICLTLR
jgi:hypothetical protein